MKIKVIQTAGGVCYIFSDMRVYRRIFDANSSWLIKMPNMTTAS